MLVNIQRDEKQKGKKIHKEKSEEKKYLHK